MQVSISTIQKLSPGMQAAQAAKLVEIITRLIPAFGIPDQTALNMFLAQCAHESAGFRQKEESLNYSARRIHEVWPNRFPDVQYAQAYARDSQKLANKVYAHRMGNGDEASGDGYRYRGSGFIQLTGKEMHQKYADFAGPQLADAGRLMRSDDYYAMHSAMWFFFVVKKLGDEASRGDIVAVTKGVNGGTIGLQERKKLFEKIS